MPGVLAAEAKASELTNGGTDVKGSQHTVQGNGDLQESQHESEQPGSPSPSPGNEDSGIGEPCSDELVVNAGERSLASEGSLAGEPEAKPPNSGLSFTIYCTHSLH